MKIFEFTMLLTKLHTIQSFLRITFNNVDGYIKKYDKTRYLALHHSEKWDRIFDRNRYDLFSWYG